MHSFASNISPSHIAAPNSPAQQRPLFNHLPLKLLITKREATTGLPSSRSQQFNQCFTTVVTVRRLPESICKA